MIKISFAYDFFYKKRKQLSNILLQFFSILEKEINNTQSFTIIFCLGFRKNFLSNNYFQLILTIFKSFHFQSLFFKYHQKFFKLSCSLNNIYFHVYHYFFK